jgi:hypothetical protein
MITITNLNEGNKNGQAKYRVMINDKFICEFWHKPTNGLGICLLEASKQVEREKWMKNYQMILPSVTTQENDFMTK